MKNTSIVLLCSVLILLICSIIMMILSNEYYVDLTETQRSLPILFICIILLCYSIYHLALSFYEQEIHDIIMQVGFLCLFFSLIITISMLSAKLDYATHITFFDAYLPSLVGITFVLITSTIVFILRMLSGHKEGHQKSIKNK